MRTNTYDLGSEQPPAKANEHVILIAGDLAGTARSAAFAYAKGASHIVLASGNDDAGLSLARDLRSRNIDAVFVHANPGSEAEIRALVDVTTQHYGHLDVEYRQ